MKTAAIFTQRKKELKRTFHEISMKSDIAESRLSDIFNGKVDCGMKTAMKIAEALEMENIPIK